MSVDFEALFRALALAVWLGVPLVAWRVRGRRYGIFGFVLLCFSLPGALATELHWPELAPAFAFGVAAAGLHLLHLIRARLRGRTFRVLVSIPGQVFIGASFLAGFLQLALWPLRGLFGLEPWRWIDLLPYALALLSVSTSSRKATEWVRIQLGGESPAEFGRLPVERSRHPLPAAGRALRVVQISDPHLGPWQSVRRLQRTLERLLAHEPDLVMLTGDFLTMEGHGSRGALAEALAPLRACQGRSYAIFGNHDHEAADEVRAALASAGARLLVDEEAVAETPVGPVQILGADYVRRERRAHLEGLLERYPRRAGQLRLLLLHDPSAFHALPDDAVDLTLSGHTHGGQIGLVSLGLDWTVLTRSRWPDHGLFGRGANRLYVHRGTGFYGFPLRVGVPGEASVLELLLPSTENAKRESTAPAL